MLAAAIPATNALTVEEFESFLPEHYIKPHQIEELRVRAELESRDVDCRNTQSGVDPSCWDKLNMEDWTRNWRSTHTCLEGEAFTSCFLRVQNMPATDCTVINTQSCGSDITNGVNVHTPEVFYVLYNIYGECLLPSPFPLSR